MRSPKRTVDVSAVLVYYLFRRDVLLPGRDVDREIRNRNGVVVAFERVDDIGVPTTRAISGKTSSKTRTKRFPSSPPVSRRRPGNPVCERRCPRIRYDRRRSGTDRPLRNPNYRGALSKSGFWQTTHEAHTAAATAVGSLVRYRTPGSAPSRSVPYRSRRGSSVPTR